MNLAAVIAFIFLYMTVSGLIMKLSDGPDFNAFHWLRDLLWFITVWFRLFDYFAGRFTKIYKKSDFFRKM